MGIKGPDVISCRGGNSAYVRRGEGRILEMERHLKCLREKLNILETMLPKSENNSANQDSATEAGLQEVSKGDSPTVDHNSNDYPDLDEKKPDQDQVCVLKTLAVKEKKLRDEIFNMEFKEKEYLQVLSQVNVQENREEEMKKVEDDFTQTDNSTRYRKGESVKKEKISRLEDCSKKLCDCLRSIQNNRKQWCQQVGDLSKEFNSFENYPGLKEYFEDFEPGKYENGNECPCGEAVKCNSCIICTCSDWEQDLKIDFEEKPEASKEFHQKEENLVKKRSNCQCFQSSSDSNQSSKSLEISNIYRCSLSKMQSEMSIETPSIPSTVDNVITGSEADKKNCCCLCKPEENCQKCCEICSCEYDYDKRNLCVICNEERFRGGTDFGMSADKEFHYGNLKKTSNSVLKPLAPRRKKNTGEKVLNNHENIISSTHASQLSKNLEIEELKRSLQDLENKNNFLRKWINDQNININPSKDEIIAALVDEIKLDQVRSKIWESQKKKIFKFGILTRDLAIGLLILFLTFSSYCLGFSGIFSLFLILKTFCQIFVVPSQICQNLSILYDTLQNFILDHSKTIFNYFPKLPFLKTSIEKLNFENALFALITILILEIVKFLFFKENSRFEIIVLKFGKNIIFFTRPLIFLLTFIKFVLLFPLTILSNLISFCTPQSIRNFSYRMMNSSIDILLLFFKTKSTFLCTSNIICIILGFLLNKISNVNELKVDLNNLRIYFFTLLGNNLEENKIKNFPDDWINRIFNFSNFLSILKTIFQAILEFVKLIYRSFEIK